MNTDDLKNIVAVTASLSTTVQFLSGILICQKIVKKGTTGEISPLSFVSGFLSVSLWLRYGFLIRDTSLILVNTVGAALFFSYVCLFYLYSIKKSAVAKQFLGSLVFLVVVLLYCQYEVNHEQALKFMGLICCFVTLLFFAAPFASLFHVFAVRNTDSLPFPIILTTFAVCMQWFFYGILIGDKFIQVPNILGCILSGFQLSLFYMFRKKYTQLENI